MNAITLLLKERFPIIPNLILLIGFAFSLNIVIGRGLTLTLPSFVAIIIVLLFLFLLRVMDEVKDYEKDILANPKRPIPSGRLSLQESLRIINSLSLLLVIIGTALFFYDRTSCLFYFISLIWIQLMNKEFFISEWLNQRPLLYAISHQIIIFPLIIFMAYFISPETSSLSSDLLWYAFLILGTFFTFEVGRKLDPDSHPILKTYLQIYGIKGVIAIIGVSLTLALLSAIRLGLFIWYAPFALFAFTSLLYLIKAPEKYKVAEGIIALTLIYTSWVVTLQELL